jgi:hypothetical protein
VDLEVVDVGRGERHLLLLAPRPELVREAIDRVRPKNAFSHRAAAYVRQASGSSSSSAAGFGSR